MKTITVLFSVLVCIVGLSGCVPAPGSSGPGRPIAAYIADDVTKAEITHRSGGTTDCASDCTVGLDGRWFRYHSECGTFNEIIIPDQPSLSSAPPPPDDGKSLSLADAERAAVNALLEKYITLGPDIVETAG